jgi:sensor c-di-GMP phosphodiesterase-like protein
MNDKFTDTSRAEQIAQKINQVAEQTHVNSQFAAELEERLRSAHTPKTSWLASSFKQVSPALRWVALMVLLGLALSLSIKTLILRRSRRRVHQRFRMQRPRSRI